ncbi:hypothetical protein POM88_034807 [Heracleum sosnowskyi]|uniref:Uncharacterized protein n=1 Tax=Heracleum sosnowskyi TaxID=360622 RepID=A0AAD8MAV9_9APIA|nr:hypothetical protein POM88_034807 [Heracleum sosnowskyi]
MSTPPSFEELYSMLLNREKRLEIYHQPSPQREAAALFVSNTRTHGILPTPHDQGGFVTRDPGRGRNNYQNSYNNRSSNRGFYRGRGRGRSNRPPYFANTTCQICNKVGHSALTCCERHNYAQQPDDLPAAFSAMSFSPPSEIFSFAQLLSHGYLKPSIKIDEWVTPVEPVRPMHHGLYLPPSLVPMSQTTPPLAFTFPGSPVPHANSDLPIPIPLTSPIITRSPTPDTIPSQLTGPNTSPPVPNASSLVPSSHPVNEIKGVKNFCKTLSSSLSIFLTLPNKQGYTQYGRILE